MEQDELINELGLKVIDLIESYKDTLPAYEIGHELILNATSMLLYAAPNELIGIKTVLASVTTGINMYEESMIYSKKQK